jgi:hypothetical protein
MNTCKGKKRDGTRCSRSRPVGSDFCYQHSRARNPQFSFFRWLREIVSFVADAVTLYPTFPALIALAIAFCHHLTPQNSRPLSDAGDRDNRDSAPTGYISYTPSSNYDYTPDYTYR